PAPSERITVGVIGLGGRSGELLGGLTGNPDAQVVALCDVFKPKIFRAWQVVENVYRNRGLPTGEGAIKGYQDFREVLARDDVDAVVIATVPHWHAPIAIKACEAGKDVYSEKPMSLSVADNYAMLQAVRRYGRVFQHGTQWATNQSDLRRQFELIRSGKLGQLLFLETSSAPHKELHLPAEPVPDDLDWDLWLGPCPWRPYNSRYLKSYGWDCCRDFTSGWLDELGSHVFDAFLWFADMERASPTDILPPDKDDPRLKIVFVNGVRILHSLQATPQRITGAEGAMDFGVVPERFRGAKIPYQHLARIPGDLGQDWLRAIRTRQDPWRNIEVAYHSSTVIKLAVLGLELNRPLKWDGAKRQFIGDDEANRLLSRSKRSPWEL
ncbi:MAG: Gfo/Idh/MocA family oxidoreductase, partial [Thermoguttaceae bacterium]